MSGTGSSDDATMYDPNQPISVLGDAPMPSQWSVGGDPSQPSILGPALNPEPWTPDDNSLNFFVDPATMETIDFSGDGTADDDQSMSAAGDDPYLPVITADPIDPDYEPTTGDIASLEQTPALPASPDNDGPAHNAAPPAHKSPLTVWPVLVIPG